MPRMVRSPSTLSLPSPARDTFRLTKVIRGWLSTSKKASLRRWRSRAASLVSMLDASMLKVTDPAVRFWGSATTAPSKRVKRPGTRLKKWRMEKFTAVCSGSTR